ncbi:MAG TPA: SDR family oxidoreductase [Dehalococcoidia bacterium]|jgi:3-oxoacyl-[acyl-carrier protein] reductase|nr:SDR family oxidoreductase [Dehalococcoidia bacterium]
METGLQGKIALVTGSGRGIGKAIALALAAEGADVVINDVNLADAEGTAQEVRAIGRRSMAIRADVTSETQVKEMVEQVTREWGGVDILVNNAGVASVLMVEDMEKAEWDRVFDVIVGGTFNCSKAVIGTMKKRGGGKIVNIGSIAGIRTTQFAAANYAAAKAAVLGFTRQLAYELGPYKINVNAVNPFTTVTPLLLAISPPGMLEKLKDRIPLRDLNKPEDIADAVVFLCSERARMITGTSINVDGGVTLEVGGVDWDAYVARRKQALKERTRSQDR